MKITKWIRDGELSTPCGTTEELLERAGNLLDRMESHDMLGDILFVGEDGKTYVVTVEAVISEANPDYVKLVEALSV